MFAVTSPIGFSVQCTESHWTFIVTYKHPVLSGKEGDVYLTLSQPDEVRRSKYDHEVYLLYRRFEKRWLCAVVRVRDAEGFLVTAYPTDALKSGETIWTSSQ
jgi:hypothetical protein